MTEHIKICRGQMIEHLTRSMFDDLEMNPEKIDDLILYGFTGYENLHTDELIKEYREYISEDPEYDLVIELEK